MRIQTSILVVGVLASASTTASADRKKRPNAKAAAKAKAHMKKAGVASQEGRNEDAVKELDAAWALDPQPMLLLARGHLYVKLEKCEDAIKLYEEFLATSPAQELRDSTTQAVDTCKATLAPPPPPPEPPKPTMVTSEEINADDENPNLIPGNRPAPVLRNQASSEVRVDEPMTTRAWFKDPILIGLGVGGAIGITAGVVLYMQARVRLDDAEGAISYGDWKSLDEEAHTLRTYSLIAGAAGALLVGGAVFYGLRVHGGKEETRVTVMPTNGGGVVGWGGKF